MTQGDVPLTDLELARRLERAEGATNAAFIDARADLHPEVGAEWIEVAGVFAMYDAPHVAALPGVRAGPVRERKGLRTACTRTKWQRGAA